MTTPKTVLVLRTCNAELQAHGGFQWPSKGAVKAPDFQPAEQCGNGLHGWLWGEGDGTLGNWDADAKWLVVQVLASDVIDLKNKVKFPKGKVVFCGDRFDATAYLASKAPNQVKAIIGHTSTSGYRGTSTSGYNGTSTSGDVGTSTSGDYGTLQWFYWDGNRKRVVTAYVGENGIKPNTPYRLNANHEPEEVKS